MTATVKRARHQPSERRLPSKRARLEADPIRLLMITNQRLPRDDPGFCEAFEEMERHGQIQSFVQIAPLHVAGQSGHVAARDELIERAREFRPNVLLVMTPHGLRHEVAWVRRFTGLVGNPVVLYWEGDSWGRWSKSINESMRAWLASADVVFSVAGSPQIQRLRQAGALDVRFVPHTYCQVQNREGETPPDDSGVLFDAVMIGNSAARFGRISRMPGAVARARLVRRLQRSDALRIAIYGTGWKGPGTKGPIPRPRQIGAIREALISVNWDHFPGYDHYASDRLPISMLAGRAHVTTYHSGFDWLPGSEAGLFMEPNVGRVVERVHELLRLPRHELLSLGAAGHRWVRNRLSNREAARFMLGAVEKRLLEGLPEEPWLRLASEWPE